jgi:hypothetical protein
MHMNFTRKFDGEKVFLTLALIIPLAVRTVPEILSWPYPIGFDTLTYIPVISNTNFLAMDPALLLKGTRLFYVVASAVNVVVKDQILEMKLLGPALFTILAFTLYIYSRRVLDWSPWKALCLNILASTYFVSLRISWEMYRQMLGTTLLFTTLILLKGKYDYKRLSAIIVSSLLTVWAHELTAVILIPLIILHLVADRGRRKTCLLIPTLSATALFMYQLYNPVKGIIQIPSNTTYATTQLELFTYITGFIAYMFAPLLPLILAGAPLLKKIDILGWSITCITFTYWPTIFPEQSPPIWFRFAIMLVYPITFISVEGAARLWRSKKTVLDKIPLGKAVAFTTILVNLIMSGYYIATPPENALLYFGEWNNYKAFVQTSMLQNSVPISDTPDLIAAIEWVKQNLDKTNTTLILHEAIDNWAQIYIKDIKIIRINEASLDSPIRENIENRLLQLTAKETAEGKQVYTIWWTKGKGWYGMPNLPEQYKQIKSFNNIAVYKYSENN